MEKTMNRNNMLIEPDELLEKLDTENLRIFDATITDDVYLQEHIPGAAYFDHERFSDPDSPYEITILPTDRLIEQIGNAGISIDSEVILYACGMLPYAARAWWVLHYAGHDNVRILNGGLSAWKNAGGKVEQISRSFEATVFNGNPKLEMFADKNEVMAALENKDISVMNVLPIQSYEGAHITGSVNLSCMDLMQDMEYFLPDDKLGSVLGKMAQYDRIITYCGGGIAAALSGMAHFMIGQENVAVYDGSLNEWIAEQMPITGTGKWVIWEANSK